MKIQSLEAIPVRYVEPNDCDGERHLCLVRVQTIDGVVGWGESITQWPEASRATREIVRGLAAVVEGMNVTHIGTAWEAMRDHTWWYGWRGGIAANAIAAIDIALWDAKGKTLGCSVLDLLGGPVYARLPAIASCHAFRSGLEELTEEMSSWVAQGYQGVKVGFGKRGKAHLGYQHDRDVAFVRLLREAVGPDAAIMVDLGKEVYWDAATAIRRTRSFEEYGLAWIEEPLGPWDPEGYQRLRDSTTTSLAWGEREWDLRGYEEVLATGCVDVVGVDPGRAHGLTGFCQVAERVTAFRRQVNAHAWSSAIVTAASLAASFASRAAKVFELKPLRNPMQHELVERPFEHVDGWMLPPHGHGLGIAIREDVVERYRLEEGDGR